MTAEQLLRRRKAETRSIRSTGNQRIKNRVLHFRRYAWAVVFHLDRCDHPVSRVTDREIRDRAASQCQRALSVQRGGRVANKVQKRLNHLIAIEIYQRQARIIFTSNGRSLLILGFQQSNNVFKQFVDIDGLFVRRPTRAEQCVDQAGQPVRFADDDIRVFV